jgi:hypothetical protein
LDYFNKKVIKNVDEIHPQAVYVATTNSIVYNKNKEELAKIKTEKYLSFAKIVGDYPEPPNDKCIEIKVGARVMFVVNNKEDNYAN